MTWLTTILPLRYRGKTFGTSDDKLQVFHRVHAWDQYFSLPLVNDALDESTTSRWKYVDDMTIAESRKSTTRSNISQAVQELENGVNPRA